MYIVGLDKANLQRLFLVYVLYESGDVIRKHTWTARHRCCRGCIKHLDQPSVMQYVNETVVELNVPAVFVLFFLCSKSHVKCMGHDSVITHVHAIWSFSQSTSELSSALSQVKITERRVKTGKHVSPTVPLSVAK